MKQAYAYALTHLEAENPYTLMSINNLAVLYKVQGHYSEAEPLCKKTLQLKEKVLGRKHHDTLNSIHNLALLYEN